MDASDADHARLHVVVQPATELAEISSSDVFRQRGSNMVSGVAPGVVPGTTSSDNRDLSNYFAMHGPPHPHRASRSSSQKRWRSWLCGKTRCLVLVGVTFAVAYVVFTLNSALVTLLVAEKTRATLEDARTTFRNVDDMYTIFRQLADLVCASGSPDIPPDILRILCKTSEEKGVGVRFNLISNTST